MRTPSPAMKGLAIAGGIFVLLIAGVLVVRGTGMLDRLPSPAAGQPVAVDTPGPGTFPEGTWTVGKDIQPGTYRVAAAVAPEAGCFWRISKSGTNGQDIVAGDIPSGGRPTVALEVGQDFTSHSCGTWVKE